MAKSCVENANLAFFAQVRSIAQLRCTQRDLKIKNTRNQLRTHTFTDESTIILGPTHLLKVLVL